MLRFFAMLTVIALIGTGVLSLVDPQSIGELIFFIFGLLAVAVVIKVGLDFVLHFKKEKDDDDVGKLLKEPEGKSFRDVQKYLQEIKKRRRKR